MELVTKCGDNDRYKPYANFVAHYAHAYFGTCARKIIGNLNRPSEKSFEQLNEFLGAGTGIDSEELRKQEMYYRIARREEDRTLQICRDSSQGSSIRFT